MYTCAFLMGQLPCCRQILQGISNPQMGAGVREEDTRKRDTVILLKLALTRHKTIKRLR